MTFALCPRDANTGNLQPLYEFVREALQPVDSGEVAWRCPVLLVDDLSVLLSLGMGAVAVLDFIHYCRVTVCWKLQVSPQELWTRRTGHIKEYRRLSLVLDDLSWKYRLDVLVMLSSG